ncbi:phosphate ABC transporter permease PstA [Nodularia spumigena CS-584]|jgi:phosphate transport system permease protein|uniref:Phosphate transport system permease protein PstA n=2 Tax=Nodularia spumigena TaxID=70799 RepID=A0A2S0QAW2_NODSP|nr:phosphate ABC transporter permease PstA [Nodularia spumigena]AHJ29220.1 Phosphate transport system permease protein PstA [Nodularia spumigena CCY9414]AVZ31450.1 phosphate transport system permease protein PstA [Nodularia spumigena UHCC 0039]MDB9384835.1 phosphate ABC transporter permease PstA [Nodularia spumigena CS-584]MEA5527617.1 phosphate ABC transporter permease PstA [Nodularia spumigena UHCC 0143]MEA5557070.1 phosphate ABC transporter permease PstA [Nodularia spumigena CH309]
MDGYQKSEIEQSLTTELFSPLPKSRQLFTYLMNAIALGLTVVALIPLLSILWEIIARGISGLKLEMFVNPVIDFGFGNAILGTATIVTIAAILSVPVGILTGIFLAEFGRTHPVANFVRFITNILTGVPSIIVGVFAYGVIVLVTKKFSAIAGGFALATIMLPVIVLTTEEALKLVPIDQRLASAALGGTRFQTTFRIVVTTAIPGITTGILLAVARAAGETAPLIFTALFSLNWSTGLLSPTASLPVLIFNLYNDPDPEKHQLVWTTSIVLLGLVLCVSIISRLVTRKMKIK